MPQITIYTQPSCGYCHAAMELLRSKGVTQWEEIDVLADPELRARMVERSGGRNTTPQIFIDGRHIGGFDDLSALNNEGKLDPLLR